MITGAGSKTAVPPTTIDPRTGQPAETDSLTATVFGENGRSAKHGPPPPWSWVKPPPNSAWPRKIWPPHSSTSTGNSASPPPWHPF
ncbi:MAG: hypothetical protein R3D55_17170 [Chloroflexota bacterium]